jgi:DNA-binding HxlR family transcriptional regulator
MEVTDLEKCPVNYALTLLAGKWKLKIVWVLTNMGRVRFNELQRQLDGISALMLSKSLKELEDDHVIIRRQYNEIPPHVEYSLSNVGKELNDALNMLGVWGEKVNAITTSNADA